MGRHVIIHWQKVLFERVDRSSHQSFASLCELVVANTCDRIGWLVTSSCGQPVFQHDKVR